MFVDIAKNVLETEASELYRAIKNIEKTDWDKIVEAIFLLKGKLILCGVGKSGLIGAKMAATFASTGTPSFFLHPTEAMHGDLGMIDKEDGILAISYSGESEELANIMPHLKRLSKITITMTRNKESSVSKMGDFFIPIDVSKEACPLDIAPTSSTTLTLALGDALAVCLMKKRGFDKNNFASFHPGGSLGKRLFVKVKDLMQTQNLPIVSSDMPLRECIIKMSEARLGSAIVAKDNKLLALLSDGDLRRAMMRKDFNLESPVIEYATTEPKYCDDPNLLAVDALKYIQNYKIQLLIITDKEKFIQGVIHLHTLIASGIKED